MLPVRVELLGGFRVERIGVARPVVWQRRTARTLTKLLATHPRPSLHREELLELLWPGVPAKSAREGSTRGPDGGPARQVADQLARENGGQ